MKASPTTPPTQGLLELREAVARKLKRENRIEADPETEVLVTDGGLGAIYAAIQSLVNPGDEVLVFDPLGPILSKRVARGRSSEAHFFGRKGWFRSGCG